MVDINTIEITEEMMEAVAIASLYKTDPTLELRKVVTQKLTSSDMIRLLNRIRKDPNFEQVKEDLVKLECTSLVDENMNTVLLQYNKLLRDAQAEKKYEVAARILGEIRKLKAIENEQMKFEIVIKVEKPEETN